jgi:hypothetical protein
MSSIDDFFSGGLPSAKFDVQGKVVGGRIIRVGDPMQQRDMATGQPKFWDVEKTQPMLQLPIDVQTEERDADIPGDTGARTLYVKGDLKRAVTEAVRKAGAQGAPKVGGTLEVAWTGEVPATQRGFNAKKTYTARYTAPAAGDGFFAEKPAPGGPSAKQAFAVPGFSLSNEPVGVPAGAAKANPFADDEPPF